MEVGFGAVDSNQENWSCREGQWFYIILLGAGSLKPVHIDSTVFYRASVWRSTLFEYFPVTFTARRGLGKITWAAIVTFLMTEDDLKAVHCMIFVILIWDYFLCYGAILCVKYLTEILSNLTVNKHGWLKISQIRVWSVHGQSMQHHFAWVFELLTPNSRQTFIKFTALG